MTTDTALNVLKVELCCANIQNVTITPTGIQVHGEMSGYAQTRRERYSLRLTYVQDCPRYREESQNVVDKHLCSNPLYNNEKDCNIYGGQWIASGKWNTPAPNCTICPSTVCLIFHTSATTITEIRKATSPHITCGQSLKTYTRTVPSVLFVSDTTSQHTTFPIIGTPFPTKMETVPR